MVWVRVDVDMSDIETDDLVTELEERRKKPGKVATIPSLSSENRHPLHEIYYALKFGLDERALQLMRAHLADELGVVL